MIYFIQAGIARGPVKIGYVGSPEGVDRRLEQLQIGSHETLYLVAMMNGTKADERALHRRFAKHHVRGEWFRWDAPGLQDVISDALHEEYLVNAGRRTWKSDKQRAREMAADLLFD